MLSALGEVKDFPGVTGRTTLAAGDSAGKTLFFGTVAKGKLVHVNTGQ